MSDEEAVQYLQALIVESAYAVIASLAEQIHKWAQVSKFIKKKKENYYQNIKMLKMLVEKMCKDLPRMRTNSLIPRSKISDLEINQILRY